MRGKNPRLLNSGIHPKEYYKNLWETILSGKEWRGELQNKKKNGEIYCAYEAITSIKNSQGVITHFLAIEEDFSERKRLERSKDEFISIAAHELRSPLVVIKMIATNFRDGIMGALNEDQKDAITRLCNRTDQYEKLLNRLLDLSRLESGRAKLQKEKINFSDLISEGVKNSQVLAQKKGIYISQQIAEQLPETFADKVMMVEILTNLLDNALRFAKSKILIEAKQQDHSIQVTVIDDGPGIEKEDLSLLFQKFKQIYLSQEKGYKGTGLGLALCKEIMRTHEGKIWVESEVGKGSRFCFSVPICNV